MLTTHFLREEGVAVVDGVEIQEVETKMVDIIHTTALHPHLLASHFRALVTHVDKSDINIAASLQTYVSGCV